MEQKPLNTIAKWAAVDLDSTLAKDVWPERGIGKPIKANIKKLDELLENGYKITIHTARPWTDYEAIEMWLIKNNIPFDNIICGKLWAALYIDDKSVPADAKTWLK